MVGHNRRIIAASLTAGLMLANLPAQAWTPEELKRLRAGDVVVTSTSRNRGGIIDASIVVPAPPRLVYTLVADPQNTPRYSPEISAVTVIEDQGLQKRVRMRVRQFGLIDEEHEVVSTYQPYSSVTWQQVKGRFAHQDGAWKVSSFDAGTILTYHLDIDVGASLPSFFIEAFLRTTIPNLMRNVRKQFGT